MRSAPNRLHGIRTCVCCVVAAWTLTREHGMMRREHFNALPSKCHDAVFGIALTQVDDYRTDPALFEACKVRTCIR